jgi:hypothetical protein
MRIRAVLRYFPRRRPRAPAILLAVAATISPAAFAQQLAPEVVLLAHVRAHVREVFAHLPNYTCLETIERFSRSSTEERVKLVDGVGMEVLYTGGAELYAAPGASRFQGENPVAFIGAGLMSTGAFALHLKAVLLNDKAQLTWRGEEPLEGRRTARWDFVVSRFDSGLTIHAAGGGSAGIQGSVWADPATLDILRLEDHAYDFPPFLPVKAATTIVNYARMRVGQDVVMLPQEGIVSVLTTSNSDAEDRNLFAFTHCRAFGSQSSIKFDAVTPAAEPPKMMSGSADAATILPAELEVPVLLEAPVTGTAAVGDPVEGKIPADIVKSGKVLIPRGAVAHGRIRRLQQVYQNGQYFAVGLEFTELEAGSERFQFYADLTKVDRIPGFQWTLRRTGSSDAINQAESMKLPGVGSFYIRGDSLLLPAGFKMVWKTRSPAEETHAGPPENQTFTPPNRGVMKK